MLSASGVCDCAKCISRTSVMYKMIGQCYNCRTDQIIMTYRSGDRASPLNCPVCGVSKSVHASRLATDEDLQEESP